MSVAYQEGLDSCETIEVVVCVCICVCVVLVQHVLITATFQF